MFAAGAPGRPLGAPRITRVLDLSEVAPLPVTRTPRWQHRIRHLDRFGRLQMPELAELLRPPEEVLHMRAVGGKLLLAHRIAGATPAVDVRHRLTIPAAVRLEWGPGAAVVVSLDAARTCVVAWPAVRLDDVVGGAR